MAASTRVCLAKLVLRKTKYVLRFWLRGGGKDGKSIMHQLEEFIDARGRVTVWLLPPGLRLLKPTQSIYVDFYANHGLLLPLRSPHRSPVFQPV